jgi:acyl-CoA thioesterase
MSHNPEQKLAEACAKSMYSHDLASQGLGIEIVEVGPGRAVMVMTVQERMLNGQGICHGGFIFSLADSTFAFACNSYNNKVVASGCKIEYVAPGQLGDRLTATATQCYQRGRSGLYDVVVLNQRGEALAFFRGNARQVKGQHLEHSAVEAINTDN